MRIMEKLLYTRKKTDLHLNLYPSVLPIFKSFVLIFELKEPAVHRLFDELKDVVRTFFSCFIKLENVKSLSIKKLAKLDVKDLNYQLPVCDWFTGSKTKELLKSLRFDGKFGGNNFLICISLWHAKMDKVSFSRFPVFWLLETD